MAMFGKALGGLHNSWVGCRSVMEAPNRAAVLSG